MTKRVQIYVADDVAERWKSQAATEGVPLGHWIYDRVRESERLAPGMELILAQLNRLLEEKTRV